MEIETTEPKRSCKGSIDVPHTHTESGNLFWKKEPCTHEPLPDSEFCSWHQPPAPLSIKKIKGLAEALEKAGYYYD